VISVTSATAKGLPGRPQVAGGPRDLGEVRHTGVTGGLAARVPLPIS
jgi:hypothetical protein